MLMVYTQKSKIYKDAKLIKVIDLNKDIENINIKGITKYGVEE